MANQVSIIKDSLVENSTCLYRIRKRMTKMLLKSKYVYMYII